MNATTAAPAISAPAAARYDHGPEPHVSPPPRPISVTVVGTLVLLVLAVSVIRQLLGLTADGYALLSLGVEVVTWSLVGIGLLRGHPLARGWTLLLGTVYFVAGVMMTISAVAQVGVAGLPVLLWPALALMVMYVLTRRHVRHFFGMTCPRCSGVRLRPSFLYGRLKCRTCSHQWKRSERVGIDVEAFD